MKMNALVFLPSTLLLLLFLGVTTFMLMTTVEQADAAYACCKVNGHRGWNGGACNIWGCNCDCGRCDGFLQKTHCLGEKVGKVFSNLGRKRRQAPLEEEPAAVQMADKRNITFASIIVSSDGGGGDGKLQQQPKELDEATTR